MIYRLYPRESYDEQKNRGALNIMLGKLMILGGLWRNNKSGVAKLWMEAKVALLLERGSKVDHLARIQNLPPLCPA